MTNKQTNRRGFTIVELLIVIVVIGILASITVVAYNGIQERARNVARIGAAGQLQRVMELVVVTTPTETIRTSLNFSDGWYRACIGKGYPDVNADGLPDCAALNNDPYVSDSEQLNQIISNVATIPSMAAYPSVGATDGDMVYGPFLASAWVDGGGKLVLEYILEGENQSCGLTPLIYYSDSGDTMTPQGDPDYTVSSNGVTECAVAIEDDQYT